MKSLRCLLTFTALLLPLRLLAQGDDFLSESVLKWERATAYTLEVARAMPASDYGFRPCPEEMTFGQQLDHMAQNMTWLAGDYLAAAKFSHPLAAKKDRTPQETLTLHQTHHRGQLVVYLRLKGIKPPQYRGW
jgi:hypothetical protein